ncbi:MAG: 1-acyl-sn-glycerol-3-phosphate acyltransferase [Candidatus Pseudothioglobus sp.]|jgi:1-acyl-sn-glycerol-3-phosphate acyltransferase
MAIFKTTIMTAATLKTPTTTAMAMAINKTNTTTEISTWKRAGSALLLTLWIPLLVALFFVGKALRLPKTDKLILVFHRGVAGLFNLDITQTGTLRQDRPTLYVSNHASYLDIFVLGSHLPGAFIAKSEVAGWPVFGKLARLQNTLFFERQTRRAGQQVAIMKAHLTHHSNLIFFPEGTSTPGTHVATFRSSLFAAATDSDTYIQPITIAYSHYKNHRMEQAERDNYAWYIPMPFLSHFLNGLGLGRAKVALVCHEPVKIADFSSRKACAVYCENVVRQGLLDALNTQEEVVPAHYLESVKRQASVTAQ